MTKKQLHKILIHVVTEAAKNWKIEPKRIMIGDRERRVVYARFLAMATAWEMLKRHKNKTQVANYFKMSSASLRQAITTVEDSRHLTEKLKAIKEAFNEE